MAHSSLWQLDSRVAFLNHGSFGACPKAVLRFQQELRDRLERQPVQFLARDLEPLLDAAREALARFLSARARDLVFVPNATTGVNTVLRSIKWRRGDELIITNHEYNACRNAAHEAVAGTGARVKLAGIPFPLRGPDDVIEIILGMVNRRTRLLLVDHVTSPTALVFPVEQIVREVEKRGVLTLIDGAHAPGMLPVNLTRLGAAFYTGNCHKWLCAPKGAAFLHVRHDLQSTVRPLVISHGANSPRNDRSRYQIEFGWTGTGDPSAFLSVPFAIEYIGKLHPGGWTGVRRQNRLLALAARQILCEALQIEPPCPNAMLGCMASVPLPEARRPPPKGFPPFIDPLGGRLLLQEGVEVPVTRWPAPPQKVLRVSCQLYNSLPQYRRVAKALPPLLAQGW
jgi:isopenicillin-N epimerase